MNHAGLTAAGWIPASIWQPTGEQMIIDETLGKVISLLRFPRIIQNRGIELWQDISNKFSGCFNFVRVWWGEWWWVFWESDIHYDAYENITLYYDGTPCAYISYSANSKYTVIQTIQWVWKNPPKLSQFDWEATLIDTVEQIAKIYLPSTKIWIISDVSHPFSDKYGRNKYNQLAHRLGYIEPKTIKRPLWLLYYLWEDIDIWLKNTD